ncbi:uncharacterized protein L969DRAFT_93754 [Mixia osmundae IAM 14324]|uniref:GIY-YIG domain-containing protein n=1 Tax=Mixia osmundae (strain CBS 9802 / IAM 14324 / JCM 22182 / KY 12970) TaxID=764103 RepID=G7E9H1_MIXOS|nr:uncharacterized protein L969DRAFT_93754 [Mixia osmundae IAM 14324]KEI39923.1 hypothetical protein L969DRAFT_93754 [Mixia osmundae IAM 14324]GAA99290.1 hypothetical protein E5Q_05985 [Mixia osmundae IAM 14324]
MAELLDISSDSSLPELPFLTQRAPPSSSPLVFDDGLDEAEEEAAMPSGMIPVISRSTLLEGAHTIPRFYACYLLRSKRNDKYSNRTYIGSTPDPPRRIRQHNGDLTAGAWKTRFGRPWEMEMIVHGFPSKLSALQFEWAWQKPGQSRHLRYLSPTSGRPQARFPDDRSRNKPDRKVSVLKAMLTSKPWKVMGLAVTVFSPFASQLWRGLSTTTALTSPSKRKGKAKEAVDETLLPDTSIPISVDHVNVVERFEGVDGRRIERESAPPRKTIARSPARSRSVTPIEAVLQEPGIGPIDASDKDFAELHWRKWASLIEAQPIAVCQLCSKQLDKEQHLDTVICTSEGCTALYHLTCLAERLLAESPPDTSLAQPLLPMNGVCPTCKNSLRWIDLIRGCYRRRDGPPKEKRTRAKSKAKEVAEDEETESPRKRKRKAKEPTASTAGRKSRQRSSTASPNKARARQILASPAASDAEAEPTTKSRSRSPARTKMKATLPLPILSDSDADQAVKTKPGTPRTAKAKAALPSPLSSDSDERALGDEISLEILESTPGVFRMPDSPAYLSDLEKSLSSIQVVSAPSTPIKRRRTKATALTDA